MIGTIQALGIFLLMILPGFLGLRVYSYGRPPLRHRGALGELGAIVLVSALGWAFLYLWRGQDLLPIVLGESGQGADPSTRERLDAFTELAAFSVVIGVLLGALARAAGNATRSAALRLLKSNSRLIDPDKHSSKILKWLVARLRGQLRARTLPSGSWDRLMTRLSNQGKRVVCRVQTRSGKEVLGVLASGGVADFEADGRGLLLDVEAYRDRSSGKIKQVPDSQGLFIPGDEISFLSVVRLPDEALSSETDDSA